MGTRSIAMAALLSSLLGVLAVTAEPAEKAAPVKVPFEVNAHKHQIVKVKINGKGPYKMLFDTGTPDVVLTTKTVESAGVKNRTIETLDLGGANAGNLGCSVDNAF